MRIRQSFGRQESTDSKRPLINDDTDASTLSLASQRTPDSQNEQTSNEFISRNSSNASKLSRPMAVIHINDSDPVDGRPKRLPPAMPQKSQKPQRKSSMPTDSIHKKEAPESQVDSSDKKDSQIGNNAQSSQVASRRTASLRDANLPEGRRLKHTSSGGSHNSQPGSVRPVRKTASQRQGYGSKFTRAFTRKSGFNLIFDEVTGGNLGSFDSDSSSDDIESDLQRFENLYQKVHKKLKKRTRQPADDDQEEETSTSDPEMSPDSEDDEKPSCREIFVGRRMRRWAFWFIVAFLAALTVKDVVELVTEYLENPKQSVINVVFNESMTTPPITFCLSKNQAYSHFNLNVDSNWDSAIDAQLAKLPDKDTFLQNTWDYRMTVEGYEVISSLSSLERETESGFGIAHAITKFRESPRLESKRNMIRKWTDALESRGITFEQFTQKVGVETIRPSMQRFQRLTFNEDQTISTKFHTTWISEKQFCFQPWSFDSKYYTVEDQGHFFTMSLLHNGDNLSNKSVNCMSVDFHGRPSSLNRFMQGKGRTRDGYDDELCPGQYHEVIVEVKALYEMLENDDNGTICREQRPDEDNEFDCKSRCRLEMLRQLCRCTPLTLSYLMKNPDNELKHFPLCDYTNCFLDRQNQSNTDSECQNHCHRDCRQVRYTVNHKTQGRLLRPDMSVVELHWGSFEYLSMKQDWVWSVTTFIAALGGSIGMWLGLSILSLIQGGSYLYSYLSDNVIKKKIRKRRASIIVPVTLAPTKPVDDADLVTNPFGNPFKQRSLRQHTATPSLNQETRTSIQIE